LRGTGWDSVEWTEEGRVPLAHLPPPRRGRERKDLEGERVGLELRERVGEVEFFLRGVLGTRWW
jgi:hypothetical protein